MLGQGPHRFIWPDTVEVGMPTAPALHMLTTSQQSRSHIDVSICVLTQETVCSTYVLLSGRSV